jgi:hypothetical protein
VIVTDPVRVPVALGENATLIWQFAPARTAPSQVLVCAKSPALAPLTANPEIASTALPELVSVTVCAVLVVPMFWEVNARLEVDRLTPAAGRVGAAPPPPHAAHTEITNVTAASAQIGAALRPGVRR